MFTDLKPIGELQYCLRAKRFLLIYVVVLSVILFTVLADGLGSSIKYIAFDFLAGAKPLGRTHIKSHQEIENQMRLCHAGY